MGRVRLIPAALLIVAAVTAAGGCGSSGHGGPSAATVTTTVTSPSSAPPSTPVSSPAAGGTTAPPQPPAPGGTSPVSATAVVSAYYNAINAKDYATAWSLGGRNLSPSYGSFVRGFADTAYDGIQILNAAADSVTLRLDAVQSDGTTEEFEGTYTVKHGVIVGAAVHAVAGSRPGGGASATSGLYKDCTDAHEHGAYSIPRGQPGYEDRLDRDHDGLACEPYEG